MKNTPTVAPNINKPLLVSNEICSLASWRPGVVPNETETLLVSRFRYVVSGILVVDVKLLKRKKNDGFNIMIHNSGVCIEENN